MIAINVISLDKTFIKNTIEFQNFINKFENKNKVIGDFYQFFLNDEVIYWSFNPYQILVNNKNEIIYSKDIDFILGKKNKCLNYSFDSHIGDK